MYNFATSILLVFLCVLSSCKTQETEGVDSSSSNLSGLNLAQNVQTSPQYSFQMGDLDTVVAAYQRNVKACPAFDSVQAGQYLIAELKKFQIPFAIVPVDPSSSGLGLVDPNVQELVKGRKNFNKYGRFVFFAPESGYPLLTRNKNELLVYSSKTGWARSALLNSYGTGAYMEEGYVYLKSRLDEMSASGDPERVNKWGLIYNPGYVVSSDHQQNLLGDQIKNAINDGKKYLIVPLHVPHHAMLSIVNLETKKIEFYESNADKSRLGDIGVQKTFEIIKSATGITSVESIIKNNIQGREGRAEGKDNPNCGIYTCFFATERMVGRTPEEVAAIDLGYSSIYDVKGDIRAEIRKDADSYFDLVSDLEEKRDEEWGDFAIDDYRVENGMKPIEDLTIDEFIDEYESAKRNHIIDSRKSSLEYLEFLSNELSTKGKRLDIELLDRIYAENDHEFMARIHPIVEDLKSQLKERSQFKPSISDVYNWLKIKYTLSQIESFENALKVEIDTYLAEKNTLSDTELAASELAELDQEVAALRKQYTNKPPQIVVSEEAPRVNGGAPPLPEEAKGKAGLVTDLISTAAKTEGLGLVDTGTGSGGLNGDTCKSIVMSGLDEALSDYNDYVQFLGMVDQVL